MNNRGVRLSGAVLVAAMSVSVAWSAVYVGFSSPPNRSTIYVPTGQAMFASGWVYEYNQSSYGLITNVSFHSGGTKLGDANVSNPGSYGSWSYSISDVSYGSNSFSVIALGAGGGVATSTVSVQINDTNSPPVAYDRSNAVVEAVSVNISASYSHADSGQSLQMIVVTPPTIGSIAATGSTYVTYYSGIGATGSDWFTYKLNDGVDDSNVATCRVTVLPNTPPVASNQSVRVLPDTATATFALKYIDPDSGQTRTFTILTPPSNGDVTQPSGTNSANVVYTPHTNFLGRDSFTWKVNDGMADSDPATCTLRVFDWNVVAVVVNTNLQPLIATRLTEYTNDLASEGHVPLVKAWNMAVAGQNKPADLRNYLAEVDGLAGAVLVGDLPVAYFRNLNEYNYEYPAATFPFDLYYMDHQVGWADTNADTYIDVPYGVDIKPEIWVSRIKCSGMTLFSGKTEADLVNRYFEKIRRFRRGELTLPDRGLLWADDDWSSSTPASRLGTAYTNATRVTSAVAGITTDLTDWKSRWRVAYETEFFMCHSSDTLHQPGGNVYNTEVAAADICRLFWNCWNCSSAKYTTGNYIAGVRLYTPTYGISAVGSTKTGSMLSSTTFYNQMAAGKTSGDAFKIWFVANYYDVSWHYGMVLLGDGTLKLGRYHQPPVASNTPPVIAALSNLSTPVTVTNGPIPVVIGDDETPATNLILWAESSNRSLLPGGNIAYGGTGTDRTLSLYPQPNTVGIATITVTVCDGLLMTSTGFTVQVTNQLPVAADDYATVTAGQLVAVAVLDNDWDPDGHALILDAVLTQPANGTAVKSGSLLLYTSTNAWEGVAAVPYRVKDSLNASATGTVYVTVVADTTGPGLVRAWSWGDSNVVWALFDEPVEAGSGPGGSENAANYSMDYGVAVTGAALQVDNRTVRLLVSGLKVGLDYVLTVNQVRDRALAANVAVNRQAAFRYLPAEVTVWVEDALPGGSTTGASGSDGWTWIVAVPAPFSGAKAHQSNINAGEHQHTFYGTTQTLAVATGDVLFAYVYLDPQNVPREVMLQFREGTSWDHRAYWGENLLNWGTSGTTSRTNMGALPPAGRWVRLEVPAVCVGVEGLDLNGMGFSLYGGRATWDYAGKCVGTFQPAVDGDGDGLSDNWEIAWFGGTGVSNGDGDWDGDAMSDRDEYLAGTDPKQADSVLEAGCEPGGSGTNIAICWPSVAGKLYGVKRGTNLAAGFVQVASNLPATPPENAFVEPTSPDPVRFYRVVVEQP